MEEKDARTYIITVCIKQEHYQRQATIDFERLSVSCENKMAANFESSRPVA